MGKINWGKVLIFAVGMFCGFVLTQIVTHCNRNQNSGNIEFFEEDNEKPVEWTTFQVVQAGPDGALAVVTTSIPFMYLDGLEIPTQTVVLLLNDSDEPFYDNQQVTVPSGETAMQVGIYRYQAKDESWKTVPVIMLPQ